MRQWLFHSVPLAMVPDNFHNQGWGCTTDSIVPADTDFDNRDKPMVGDQAATANWGESVLTAAAEAR